MSFIKLSFRMSLFIGALLLHFTNSESIVRRVRKSRRGRRGSLELPYDYYTDRRNSYFPTSKEVIDRRKRKFKLASKKIKKIKERKNKDKGLDLFCSKVGFEVKPLLHKPQIFTVRHPSAVTGSRG